MGIQMIVTDLDRTLLHTDKTLSANTVDVLERCRARGVKIVFATARSLCGVANYVNAFAAPPDALILRNGAEVNIGSEPPLRFGIAPDIRDEALLGLSRAFGDDYNDVEMLKNCGTGVAVANGIPQAKEAANFVCGTNNSDGVAKWLEENVL